ncbi:M61 family metallopeptidase [Leptolyngbya sp. GGD]|uniref:M61 family metallopeptidase n=1 Tax=Leptolyngbya sp. GGD TaxID=2997907 RepID=UPI00227B3E66|nr:M61 family metallopeptidase [Leptolyngbya sp. GGD]MCY6490536.1 M61 family metallopeptidase [Leptolyngbya sp. GGD]
MNREDFDWAGSQQSQEVSDPVKPFTLHYAIAMPQPETHLFEVTLQIRNCQSATVELKMPVWTPGSYLVREYSRHLQGFKSASPWRKLAKNHYQISTEGKDSIELRYQIFANELTVRTNHLDENHGYFNGAALFFYVPGFQNQPIQVMIEPPYPDWKVVTALPAIAKNTFIAKDFDTLVDSPFEIGKHQSYEFDVLGKPHQFVIWGEGKFDLNRLIHDTKKVVEVEAELFGGLPYDRYFFLLHLTANSFGGLEHKDCCSLIYSRLGFRAKDKYDRFIQLVAHEFFHLWNVKRIRPKALEVFDYEGENYTPSLWFSEGTTSFYDLILPYRAGVYDAKAYLNALSQEITRYLNTPGRMVQPLSESSFDAWIKLYRPDANSANSQISYYLKGEMVTLLLDLAIRIKHANQRSFDDVMRQMWEKFGKDEIGFTPEDLTSVIESIAGFDLTNFFDRYLHGTEELPFDEYLAGFGLRLSSNAGSATLPPLTGMTVKTENGREMIKFVEAGSPAQKARIDPGDELLAIDGLRVASGQFEERLRDYKPGDTIELTLFHGDELKTRSLTLGSPRATQFAIEAIEQPSSLQQSNFEGWLGVPLSAVSRSVEK